MGLKILHTADWHLDAAFASFDEAQREALRRRQRLLPGEIARICRRENCDMMLLAGDVFDGTPTRETLDALRQALAECAVPVFITPGNHDFCRAGSPWLEETWPENVTVFTGDLESVALPELDCRVYGAGYRSMECGPLLEGFRAQGSETYQVGVLHADPVMVRSAYCPVTVTQIRNSGLNYLGLGHIHKSGFLRSGATLCAWPGCPMGRGWDETGEKGVFLVTLEETASLRFLPLEAPRFHTMELDVSDGAEAALYAVLPAAGSEDYFRITLTGEASLDLAALQRRFAAWPNLILGDNTVPRRDVWEDTDSDTFRGAYFRLLQQQAETDPAASLAAEISRRILEGREVKLP